MGNGIDSIIVPEPVRLAIALKSSIHAINSVKSLQRFQLLRLITKKDGGWCKNSNRRFVLYSNMFCLTIPLGLRSNPIGS